MGSIITRLFFLVFLLAIVFFVIYFFVLPPQVIDFFPENQAKEVPFDSSLIIKFNKPVKRQMLQPSITPFVHREWKFQDPLFKNHLFRTLVFTPAINFQPNTWYQVKLEKIISPLTVGWANNFSFKFKTKAILQKETQPPITFLNIPLDWQDHPLSCEAASLKMALAGKGVFVSENEIMEKIGYDPTPHKNNIWGDPHKAYVGNIDGKICSTGYGVYWEPVERAAKNWREAKAFSGWELKDLVKEIQLGNPVIVWGVLPTETLTDCSWYTLEGKYIKAFKETHVRVVIGFIGPSENPSKIILNDPLAGRLYWPTPFFLKNWKVFGYSGVVIR